MRLTVYSLLLANLLFYGATHWLHAPPAATVPALPSLQLVEAAAAVPAAPAPAAPAASTRCEAPGTHADGHTTAPATEPSTAQAPDCPP